MYTQQQKQLNTFNLNNYNTLYFTLQPSQHVYTYHVLHFIAQHIWLHFPLEMRQYAVMYQCVTMHNVSKCAYEMTFLLKII